MIIIKKSGKYKIGEKMDTKRNEWLFNKLDGEYFDGKGKEYYLGYVLKFEGEYLKGEIWNGKGYNKDGQFVFEIKMDAVK